MPKKLPVKKSINKINAIEAPLYNLAGDLIGKSKLPVEIFSKKENPALVAQAIRVYRANQRAGTASTKTRSEVTGSTRKIYRQKGTGRARHGDIKAPIFIGGGIAHGPKPRDFSLDLPKKMRSLALFTVLSQSLKDGKIKVVKGLDKILPKTKNMMQLVYKLYNIPKNKKSVPKILLVVHQKINNLYLSCRNLNYLTLRPANLLNAYEVLSHPQLLFLDDSIEKLKETFIKTDLKVSRSEISPKSPQVKEKKSAKPVKPVKRKIDKKISSAKKPKTKIIKAKIRK